MDGATEPRLRAIALEGYRCFGREERLELAPLTLLFGRNNAGKSAALRALAIIARSVAEDAQGPWDMGDRDGPGRGATFRGLPWRGGSAKRFAVTLEWRRGDDTLRDTFEIEQDDELAPAFVRRIALTSGDETVEFRRVPSDDATERMYECSRWTAPRELRIVGLVPEQQEQADLEALAARLKTLRGSVQWIHGGRVGASRDVRLTGTMPRTLRADGSDASVRLVMDQDAILEPVRAFYAHKSIKRDLRIDRVRSDAARLYLDAPDRESWKMELADVGEGMGKVLSVLVATAVVASGRGPRIAAIEDPDVHLHDDAVRALAEHLAPLASGLETGRALVLETHSRTLMLAVQNAVRLGKIKAEQVNLVWAQAQDDGQTLLSPVPLGADGMPQNNLLRSAFEEDGELAAALAGLRPATDTPR